MERFGMGLLLTLVTLISTFNILGLMSLYRTSKESEKWVLLSLGMSPTDIRGIFTRLGLWMSVAGSVPGLLLGLGSVAALSLYPLPLPEAYYMAALPIKMPWILLCLFLSLVISVTTAAAWWVGGSSKEAGTIFREIY